jgi:hypothetical protein
MNSKAGQLTLPFYLGGWKARGIPKGGVGHVLAKKAKNGEKFSSAGRSGPL